MSPINHEAGLAGLNTNQRQKGRGLCTPPASPGGCTAPPTCGPSSEGQKEMVTPQAIPGSGPQGGLGDEGSFGGALIKSYIYKGDDISPHISPSAEVSASAKTKESSVAARVREIVQAASGTFTVDEITREVVNSLIHFTISRYPEGVAVLEKAGLQQTGPVGEERVAGAGQRQEGHLSPSRRFTRASSHVPVRGRS